MQLTFTFRAEVWLYGGDAAWHFITLPKKVAAEIKDLGFEKRRGFGAVKVGVTIEDENWTTSIFPASKLGSYILPVKKEIRKKLDIENGDKVEVTLTVRR